MARTRTAAASGVKSDKHGDGACACSAPAPVGPGGRAVAVDPAAREANLKRLRRVEGQVRGIQKMVEEGRWCADVLTQLGAVQEALRAVGRELLRNHLRHCAADALREGGARSDAMVEELVDLVHRAAR